MTQAIMYNLQHISPGTHGHCKMTSVFTAVATSLSLSLGTAPFVAFLGAQSPRNSASLLLPLVIISKQLHPVLCHHGNHGPTVCRVLLRSREQGRDYRLLWPWSGVTSIVPNRLFPILWKGKLRKQVKSWVQAPH